MSKTFYKFPSTPHLAVLGDMDIREDKVMSDENRKDFLGNEIVVEEKVDGANLGISFDPSGDIMVQNRGTLLHKPFSGQWRKLSHWLSPKVDLFFDFLGDRYILFGEWCYAEHSISYEQLPDWLLGFDVYDKKHRRFFSYLRRNDLFCQLGIVPVPVLGRGCFSLEKLKGFLTKSSLGTKSSEGIYLRRDGLDWLLQRAKLVRPEFVQTIGEHWFRKTIQPNHLNWKRGLS
ncbi:MAG: RNA ligase family protein [Deltaproteobacteria bacterium]|nr:RNA ligase family protein [Deltaproteobacteria bacterium]